MERTERERMCPMSSSVASSRKADDGESKDTCTIDTSMQTLRGSSTDGKAGRQAAETRWEADAQQHYLSSWMS